MAARIALGAGLLVALVQVSAVGLAAQASKGVHVCLGTDNLLRFTTATRCPQGQRMFRLAEVEDEVGLAKERDDPPNAVIADLKAKIDLLSRRVGNLEMEALKSGNDPKLPTQVKAPFEVVDRTGNPVFVVADVPHASVTRKGRIEIGRTPDGSGYTMMVRTAAGSSIAAIGEIGEGGGWFLADPAGATRVYSSGSTGLQLFGKNNITAVHLTSGSSGAGRLSLYDNDGTLTVRAGTLTNGLGAVMVGPKFKCAPEGGLRVGDCIRGRQ